MEWRSIPILDGAYEASDSGLIRRLSPSGGARPGRLLSLRLGAWGYFTCAPSVGNKSQTQLVHRLVADAFLGPCPHKNEVNHKNLDKTDNRVHNLEYVTRSGNLLHRSEAGVTRGENNHNAKLTEVEVRDILRRHVEGEGYKRLALAFSVHWSTIRDIIKHHSWAWVKV